MSTAEALALWHDQQAAAAIQRAVRTAAPKLRQRLIGDVRFHRNCAELARRHAEDLASIAQEG